MARSQHFTAVSVFDTRSQAEELVEELRRAGFHNEQIGVAVRRGAADKADTRARAGYGAGALAGKARGVLAGIAASLGVLPLTGPVIARGLLVGLRGRAASSADGGGLVSALMSLGIPEEEARYYDVEFRAGRTIVTVRE